MAEKKSIAVVGATGAQGGGLARAILADPSGGFAARALTRKPGSDKAKELAARGAEVVACDLDDPASVERAFAGAHAAYCVTNYWEHLSVDREMAQARAQASAEDIGRCAYGILKKGGEYAGRTVGIAGEHLTGTQMAASLGKALGRDVVYNAVTPEAYRSFGFPGAEDLGNMFQFKRDFESYYCGARSVAVSRALNPALQTFDTWLA